MATTREQLVNTPRSGARPLFAGQPSTSRPRGAGSGSPRPRPAPSRLAPRRPQPVPSSSPGTGRSSRGPAAPRGAPAGGGRARSRRQPSRLNQAASYARAGRQVTAPEFRNYQGIILAEFVLAELLVAATPIATRDSAAGLSPYVPRDLTKLLSIGLLFFLLELMSVGGSSWGRAGAWLGGLVLLTVGLGEANNLARDLDLFAGIKTAVKKTPKKGASPAPVTEV